MRNVADAASPPSAKSARAPEMAWWQSEELRAFLDFVADDQLAPLFRVAAMTGMRRGEVCALRWSDLDLDAGRATVRQQLVVVDHVLMFSERTKTDHGRRNIDLDAKTVSALRAPGPPGRQPAGHRSRVPHRPRPRVRSGRRQSPSSRERGEGL